MNELTGSDTARDYAPASGRLKEIEYRIDMCLRGAYERIVEVGRYLNTVKSEKLVPHGEWESWLKRVTGMSERQAQRWMQIARTVPEGSYLSRLDISKMRMILALPESEREPLAQKAVEEDLDTAQVKSEIEALKARAQTAETDCANLREYAAERAARVTELEKRLKDAEKATDKKGISAEAARQIEKLKGELESAQAFGRLQAEKRQQAQSEIIDLKQQLSDKRVGEAPARLTGDELLASAQEFIRVAGVMPHMGREFSRMAAGEKRPWEQCLELMLTWCRGAKRALDTVEATVEG